MERRTGSSDDDIAAYTIGRPTRLDGPVFLADADPRWADDFAEEAARIRGALGEAALRLEHVGSTSVPGLAAKPIIDIVLAVADSADESAYVPALESAGYVLRVREPDWHEHRVLKGPDRDVNLHVFTIGDSEIARMVTFRDVLRTEPQALDRYLEHKRALAARHWTHVQHYADAKTPVIDQILADHGTRG